MERQDYWLTDRRDQGLKGIPQWSLSTFTGQASHKW